MANNKSVILGIILSLFTLYQGYGMKYKILLLNTPSITIDNKEAKVGDWFDDECEITWSNDNQAMKVISEDNHRYTVSPSAYKKAKAKKFKDYILDVKPMAHRGVSSISERLEDIQYYGCLLMDSIYLDFSNTGITEDDVLIGEFVDPEGTIYHLPFIKEDIYYILNRDSFLPFMNKIEGSQCKINIFYNGEKVLEGFEIEIINDKFY